MSRSAQKKGAGLIPSVVARRDARGSEVRTGQAEGHRIGRLVGWSFDDVPLVDFPGNSGGPLPARTIVNLQPSDLAHARADATIPQREVLLAFDDGRMDRPIIMGVLRDVLPEKARPQPDGGVEGPAVALDAVVDGKRVVIEGHDEIVLKCGQASITLRRNGRVVVRGTYVETRATGTNRIRGGSVEIN